MAVEALMQGRTDSELRAAVACLERGMPWEEVAAWLMHARTGISGAAYERALQLFADSQLLRWEECVRVGEPLAYRSPALEALSRR